MRSKRILLIFVLVATSLSVSLLSEEATSTPELLPPPDFKEAQTPKATNHTIVYDSSWKEGGFFNDTGVNKGLPRYLNALDLSGYLRTRFNYFRNASLGTYVPELKFGTSNFLPNLSFVDQTDITKEANPTDNNFGANMRLRVDPTINISQTMRVRSTIDILDNLVLGSTPSALGIPDVLSMSQNPPLKSSLLVKRAWAEATFPVGDLRFGRMPFHFGLGILYNSGDEITSDYGDTIDGIMFSTRINDLYVSPGYSIAYTGPIGRGGGFYGKRDAEDGQLRPLDPSSLTHVFLLSLLKRDSEFVQNQKREAGEVIFNYGLLTSYRRQYIDAQVEIDKPVKRNAHIGVGSLWSAFSYKTFHMEAEASGIWGKYTAHPEDSPQLLPSKADVWLLQGGAALESRYGFLDDRLQLGLDAGLASWQSGPGFGIREGSKQNPELGDSDGNKMTNAEKYKTNFKFNPAYGVDLLLHREVLGTVASTVYFKPHLAYFFSRNCGIRGDVITTLAPDKSNTPGNSNWLGVEVDGNAFLRADNGMYFSLAYGLLFPLSGLSHRKERLTTQQYDNFGTPKVAQTVQAFFGLTF